MAPNNVAKIPNCAAAPSNNIRGFAISALKSVSAPTPIKISNGNTPVSIPMGYIYYNKPPGSDKPATGMFVKIAPKPIGSKSNGSKLRAIAQYSSKQPTAIMISAGKVKLAIPVACQRFNNPSIPSLLSKCNHGVAGSN